MDETWVVTSHHVSDMSAMMRLQSVLATFYKHGLPHLQGRISNLQARLGPVTLTLAINLVDIFSRR